MTKRYSTLYGLTLLEVLFALVILAILTTTITSLVRDVRLHEETNSSYNYNTDKDLFTVNDIVSLSLLADTVLADPKNYAVVDIFNQSTTDDKNKKNNNYTIQNTNTISWPEHPELPPVIITFKDKPETNSRWLFFVCEGNTVIRWQYLPPRADNDALVYNSGDNG